MLGSVLSRFIMALGLWFSLGAQAHVDVQLAKRYADKEGAYPVSDYLVSEKYDGVRGIWTGHQLLTRQGHKIHAPTWFIKALPKGVWLDGELWTKHKDFATASSIVLKDKSIDDQWHRIHYMIFDAPDDQHTFEQRSRRYTKIVKQLNVPFIEPIKQFTVSDNQALSDALDRYVKKGAEGLVLHRKAAMFKSGRSGNLLKLKPYMDAEATVIGKTQGHGKYSGLLGALVVKMPSGKTFKIGTGFSDKERAHPPQIGDVVTYKYHGFTRNGLPRFASFMRVRYSATQASALP